jgi:two-component system, OmpR family, response regulator
MRVLIVEDDEVIADGLKNALMQSGYAVDVTHDGEKADAILAYQSYDIVLLDLGLPKMGGFDVLKKLRSKKNQTPVLILTANDQVINRVRGLDLGADDYLSKPFDLAELEARVRALIRRGSSGGSAILTVGGLEFDATNRMASFQNISLNLSSREIALLEIFMHKPGKVISKEQILDKLCNFDEDISENALEVYLHRLRKKIEHCQVHIKTIRGLGYLMESTLNSP